MLSHLNILEIIVIFFVFLAINFLINFLGSRVRIHLAIWALVILNFLLLIKFMAIWLIAKLIITVRKLFRWGNSWSVECLLRSFKSFGVKIFWTAFSFQILDVKFFYILERFIFLNNTVLNCLFLHLIFKRLFFFDFLNSIVSHFKILVLRVRCCWVKNEILNFKIKEVLNQTINWLLSHFDFNFLILLHI